MANNIFGIILAGGQGTRMGNAELPETVYGDRPEANYRSYH